MLFNAATEVSFTNVSILFYSISFFFPSYLTNDKKYSFCIFDVEEHISLQSNFYKVFRGAHQHCIFVQFFLFLLRLILTHSKSQALLLNREEALEHVISSIDKVSVCRKDLSYITLVLVAYHQFSSVV